MSLYLLISAGATLLISGLTILVRHKATATILPIIATKKMGKHDSDLKFSSQPDEGRAFHAQTSTSPIMVSDADGRNFDVAGADMPHTGKNPDRLVFEKWVESHTHPRFWKKADWPGDKVYDGMPSGNYRHPDLLFTVTCEHARAQIALECEWRNSFDGNNRLVWATEAHITGYNHFERMNNARVFIVIGVGGNPAAPTELYIIPLKLLTVPIISKEYMQAFLHQNKSGYFYYNFEKERLRLMSC